jgi:hypothetical protein
MYSGFLREWEVLLFYEFIDIKVILWIQQPHSNDVRGFNSGLLWSSHMRLWSSLTYLVTNGLALLSVNYNIQLKSLSHGQFIVARLDSMWNYHILMHQMHILTNIMALHIIFWVTAIFSSCSSFFRNLQIGKTCKNPN